MASRNLDQIRQDLSSLDTQLAPLEERVAPLKKEKSAAVKAIRKHMEQNRLTELTVLNTKYTLEDEDTTKCTLARMRATLPEDVVEQYVQANTVTEPKFRKTKIPTQDP